VGVSRHTAILVTALLGCGPPQVDCTTPLQKFEAMPQTVGLLHQSSGPLLVATAYSGIAWANITRDGSLVYAGSVDAEDGLWWLDTRLGTFATPRGFELVTDKRILTVDTSSGAFHTTRFSLPSGSRLVSAFPGPDGTYGITTDRTSGQLVETAASGDITAVGAPFPIGAANPGVFAGGWDPVADVFWLAAGQVLVELDGSGNLLAAIPEPANTWPSAWAREADGTWIGITASHLVTFSLPGDAPASVASFGDPSQPGFELVSHDLEPDGTDWLVAHTIGGPVSIYHWREGAPVSSPQVDTSQVEYCDWLVGTH